MASVVMRNTISGVESITVYNFEDPSIVWEAMQAAGSGVFRIGDRRIPDGNKRLALLGDAVLKLALLEGWYNGGEPRGRANQIVSDVGSNANLDRIGREAGLDMFINTNPAQGRTISPVTMTATVEAVLGAVYLDGDMDAVKRVMEKLGLRAV